MQTIRRLVALSAPSGKPRPVALFKNSLREWQVRYQARRSTQQGMSNKMTSRTVTASRLAALI
jgi:hypothetical protein